MFFSKKDRDGVLEHTKGNRDEVMASDKCACLGCCAIFPAGEVTEWVDELDYRQKGEIDRTAICPHCGEALLIGDHGGYQLTNTFIEAMRIR